MAYSDYGGYAYKNGSRVEDRSDAVLSPEGIKSTPGAWPGWTIEAARSGGSHHALLGDGPIFVGLYKQSYLTIHRLGEKVSNADFLVDPDEGAIEEYEGKPYINTEHFNKISKPCRFEIDGHKITAYWLIDDNHYQFVKLEQPDGTVWTGFSGYGVGAGLEDADYGYSTDDQIGKLHELFPIFPPASTLTDETTAKTSITE